MLPYRLYATDIRAHSRACRNSSMFSSTYRNLSSGTYVYAANLVYQDVDIFKKPITYLKRILC
jgi:hypothetical protein